MLIEDLVDVFVGCSGKFTNTSSIIMHVVQIFSGEKPWWIWQITSDLSNCIVQILTISHDINKESKQADSRYTPKFCSPKVSDGKFHKLFLCQKFALCCSSYYKLKYNTVHALMY